MGALIDRLIAASLRHRALVVGATTLLAAAGLWSFATLNTDAFPDLTPNQVLVMIEVPGLSPAEVEQQVTYPMEVAMLGLPRTTDVRSISKVGLSVVTVTFEDAVDLYFARAQVQQRMQDALHALPPNAEAMLGPPATAMGEAFQYLVERTDSAADTLSLIELTNVQEYIVKPLLKTVPGVAEVNTWGGMLQQFDVFADPSKLSGYGLTLHDLEAALANNNANFGAGYVEDRGERLTVRGIGRVNGVSDIANVVVATRGATPVYVRDVARVDVGPQPRFGLTANLMSLGALDFGLIVDASVVMVENFVRRLAGARSPSVTERQDVLRAAAFEVGRPIVFGIAIIVAVYIPIFALQGLEGRMFRPMAFTVCAAVLGSLLLALSYVPAVASYLFARGGGSSKEHDDPAWFVKLRTRYQRALEWSLRHRRRVVGAPVCLFAVAIISVAFLGTEFMPKLDEGYLLIETRRIQSASLPHGIAVSDDVERTLRKFPEVQNVVTNLGRPHEATETMALHQADVYVVLNPKRQWRVGSLDELIVRMDSALSEIPGLVYEFSAPMRMRLDEVISGVRTELGVKVYGDSLPLLEEKADEIERVVRSVRGAEDVSVGVSAGAMQLEVDLDRAAIARYGLNVADVREAREPGVGGMQATEVIDGRRRFPIVVRLAASFRSTPEAVEQTLIRTPAGGTVTLSQVARVRTVEGPEVINHEGGQRYVVVQSNVRGRDLGGVAADVKTAVRQRVTFPPGYYVTYGGQFENQSRATRRLAIIVPLVLLAIAGLLYATFDTLRHAVLVMLAVPFALVGGIAALWFRGLHINLSAPVGFIALFGVAVLNGVVLVTYINQLRAGGRHLHDAVLEGAIIRLRPVLMTALVASVGFIPMAISTGAGAEVQRPLATVVIGGLVTSTLLTLLVLPTLYGWVETMGKRPA